MRGAAVARSRPRNDTPDHPKRQRHHLGFVRFAPKADKRAGVSLSPLCANSDLTRRSTDRRYSITSSARARRGSNSVVAAFTCEKSWSGTSRFARVQGTAFCPLKKVIRPAPPTLGHSGNRKQPVGFMAITGVDAKYMPNGEIMIGSLDHPDLVSGPHITLDDAS